MIDVLIWLDESAPRGGVVGGYRARLRVDPRIHDAGATIAEAYRACVTTAIASGWEADRDAYRPVLVSSPG